MDRSHRFTARCDAAELSRALCDGDSGRGPGENIIAR